MTDAYYIDLAAVLENWLEAPGLKPLIISCAESRCFLFVQQESFLIGKPWSSRQPLQVLMSFFLVWTLSVCNIFSACETVPVVFTVNIASATYWLKHLLSLFWENATLIPMCNLPHISFSFSVVLSHWILHDSDTNFLSLILKLYSA